MNKILVTTSWDDGHVLDLKLAEMLNRYNIAGTFYISPEDHEIAAEKRLDKENIKNLSRNYEVGAHTMTHPKLSEIDDMTAQKEIISSKKALEDIVGKPVTSFCYPSGDYQKKHTEMVRNAGFSLARTVKRFSTEIGKNPFETPTTIHAYKHWSDILPILKEAGPAKFINHYLNWDELAIALFDKVFANGGVFHLWGHSWEIEKNGDWNRLENVLKHIANRPTVNYVPNNALI